MNHNGIEDLISVLYEMIQDAKGVPFSGDKCSVDRNRALDLLDDLSNHTQTMSEKAGHEPMIKTAAAPTVAEPSHNLHPAYQSAGSHHVPEHNA